MENARTDVLDVISILNDFLWHLKTGVLHRATKKAAAAAGEPAGCSRGGLSLATSVQHHAWQLCFC